MSNRLRIVGFTVQPHFMVDDGDNLQPLQIQPVEIPAAEWPNVLDHVAKAVEQLRQQVEAPDPDAE